MRNVPHFLAIFAAVIALSGTPAFAGKRKKDGAGQQTSLQPTRELEPFITDLEPLLSLEPEKGKKAHRVREEAPGQIAVLERQFTTARATAKGPDAAKLDAAIATCKLLTAAIDERQKAAGHIVSSSVVGNSGMINAPSRKDALNQGVRGRDFAKAVGEVEEGKREAAEKFAAQIQTQKTDDAMTAMAINRWNQRSVELRKQITAAYARIGN
jgi:hypothetical protein